MPYHLKAGESVPSGLKRIARDELESAAGQLENQHPNRDEAVHEARKSVKKVRAVLRLLRPELGAMYQAENTRLRDAGRTLSDFRDYAVIIETFDGLMERFQEDLGNRKLASIRRGLVHRKQQHEEAFEAQGVLGKVSADLAGAAKDVKEWPLETEGFSALAPGLERSYRRARQAHDDATKSARAEDFHEWRKCVKDHWYHLRLLEPIWTDVMKAYEKSLKDLETSLGEEHNLVVLRQQVEANPNLYGSEPGIDQLFHLIAKHQKELRDQAMSLGERIYEEKPRQFTRRVRRLWDAAESQAERLTNA